MFEQLDFFFLQFDVTVDLVFGEDVASQQEVMISLEAFDGFTQGTTNGRDPFELFCRQIIQVLVHCIARMDLVLDAVKASHQQCGEAEIRVGRRIREASLNAFCLWRFSPGNTNAARTVACGIGTQNRSFKARDQAFVGVGRWVGESIQGFCMLQDTTDEIQGFVGQISIFVASKERLAVFPDGHVAMHAEPLSP